MKHASKPKRHARVGGRDWVLQTKPNTLLSGSVSKKWVKDLLDRHLGVLVLHDPPLRASKARSVSIQARVEKVAIVSSRTLLGTRRAARIGRVRMTNIVSIPILASIFMCRHIYLKKQRSTSMSCQRGPCVRKNARPIVVRRRENPP